MSTFAVFGMTRDQALAEARKTVKTTRKTPKGEESLTMDEWTALCEKRADEIMQGQKVKQLSPMFDAPQFAREFIEVARRTLECRSLQIRFRSARNDETGKLIINKKTGAPVVTWQDYRHD